MASWPPLDCRPGLEAEAGSWFVNMWSRRFGYYRDMTTGQLRFSLLNVPFELSPLKVRTWLRGEIADVQYKSNGPHDLIVVRLIISERQVAGITLPKLDRMLQSLVDKHPNLQTIQLHVCQHGLTAAEMQEEAKLAGEDMRELIALMTKGNPPPSTTLH